jgi:nucleoside-diphosphate-sugar epimerase
MSILITGASGFVGTALTAELQQRNLPYALFNRADNANIFNQYSVNTIIYLAARVHVMHETASDPLVEFRQANVIDTISLAKRAVAAGVKRFVYVSSVKVNGELTTDTPFIETDTPNPIDPYGISKYEAEVALLALSKETGLEVVIVRPPLIYGKGVKANFALLAKIAGKGIPLPLGAVHNQRSMVYVGNLVDFLILCAQPILSSQAAGETFLISDGQDISTTYLLKALAKAQGKPSRLIPVPAALLGFALKCVGKSSIAQRLLGNLQIDSSKARTVLNWQPPYTVEQGLIASVTPYK